MFEAGGLVCTYLAISLDGIKQAPCDIGICSYSRVRGCLSKIACYGYHMGSVTIWLRNLQYSDSESSLTDEDKGSFLS
jgi:hypothetical protein